MIKNQNNIKVILETQRQWDNAFPQHFEGKLFPTQNSIFSQIIFQDLKKNLPPTVLYEAIQGSSIRKKKGSNPRQGILENGNPVIKTKDNLYNEGGEKIEVNSCVQGLVIRSARSQHGSRLWGEFFKQMQQIKYLTRKNC